MMPTNLINIGRSGAAVARASIELTAQNIANASNPEYTRRRLEQSELVGTANINLIQRSHVSGVQVDGIGRFDNQLLQRQVRASTSDLSRVEAEISGLRDAEIAIEQSGLFDRLVQFEAALTLLESDPTDPALRTGAVETARQLAETFHLADFALNNSRDLAQAEVDAGVEQVNGAAAELARINVDLVSAQEGTVGRAALLDARDAALRDLSGELGIAVNFDEFGAAEVRVEGPGNPVLVSGNLAGTVSSSIAADGSVAFDLGGAAFTPSSGSLAGRSAALAEIFTRQADLDAAAVATVTRANAAQAAGVALDGSPGQPLFSGGGASDIALVLSDGAGLALAHAGSPPGSRDTANLGNLIAAFGADDGPINRVDASLLSLSSRIAGLDTTREGLAIINTSAEAELLSQTGVDLDTEAANLIRLQQAFEANSRVIQVASELFDTILGLN